MGCSCSRHSTNGGENKTDVKYESAGRSKPLDQCIACAWKHIADAHEAWSEFTYTNENRTHILGQLQLAIHHTYRGWKHIAEQCRYLSHAVQQGNDAGMADRWNALIDDVCTEYKKAHKEEK